MAKNTSRVFATYRFTHQLLAEALKTMPPHPSDSGATVELIFGDTNDTFNEAVIISGEPASGPVAEWVSMGHPSQEERFAIRLICGTVVPGMTGMQAFDRLEQIADVVQTTFRDQTTGQMNLAYQAALRTNVTVIVGTFSRLGFYSIPEGFGASADLDLGFAIRI